MKHQLRNRATTKDRPTKRVELRTTDITLPGHPCRDKGHDTVFLRDDNYGCCKTCGNEVLV